MLPGVGPLDLLRVVMSRARSVRVFHTDDGGFMVSIERQQNAFAVTHGDDLVETINRATVEFIGKG